MTRSQRLARILTSLLLISVSATVSIYFRTTYPTNVAYAPPDQEAVYCGAVADDRVAGRVGCASLARITQGGSTVFLAPADRK